MAPWGILTLICVAFILVEARFHQKRDTKSHLCDSIYNNTNKIQCYCMRDVHKRELIRSAECSLTVDGIDIDDDNWNSFDELVDVGKLAFRNDRAITFNYIPTNALKHAKALSKFEMKYGNIDIVEPFAIANLSLLREITLTDNHIKVMKRNAFAHHKELITISLDLNEIVEINRDVFVDLPSLRKMFINNNKITTIHDRAFVHLINLRDLEIDTNKLFSLNSESFAGLKNLETLDLSSNSLEVIGDNTFKPLQNLQILNLDSNQIQMLDEKAFNGLVTLRSLSLARNKLTTIDNVKIFKGLKSLTLMTLKGNNLNALKAEVMAPILQNFYNNISSLNVDDNNFTCDCQLDWFVSLMSKTESPHLKLSIENMKCMPSKELKEKWVQAVENDKNAEGDDGNAVSPAEDYEYYDESQLNGKLFYTDLRYLLNCSDDTQKTIPNTVTTSSPPTTLVKQTAKDMNELSVSTHKPEASQKISNQGLLDISEKETQKPDSKEKQPSLYTTSRLATVSAKPEEKLGNREIINPVENFQNRNITKPVEKVDNREIAKPIENNFDDREMASDEAKPDKIKAHRSVQDIEDTRDYSGNNAINNQASIFVLLTLCIKLF